MWKYNIEVTDLWNFNMKGYFRRQGHPLRFLYKKEGIISLWQIVGIFLTGPIIHYFCAKIPPKMLFLVSFFVIFSLNNYTFQILLLQKVYTGTLVSKLWDHSIVVLKVYISIYLSSHFLCGLPLCIWDYFKITDFGNFLSNNYGN